MVELVDDALEVADPVAVRIGERPRVDLVEDGGLPPRHVGLEVDRQPAAESVTRRQGRGCQSFTDDPAHALGGMWFIGNLHWLDGGELVCSRTTRYSVGPENLSGP